MKEFITVMRKVFVELSRTLTDLTDRVQILSTSAKVNMLPSWLQPGQTLMGKYFI
jgi:hypothetical protein